METSTISLAYEWTILQRDMSLKYHMENSIFKGPIIKLANIFGIIPFYDFNQRKLIHKTIFKIYGTLLTCFMTTITIASYQYRHPDLVPLSPHLRSLQVLVIAISLILFLVIVLGASFWNMESWWRLIDLLSYTKYYGKFASCNFLNYPGILIITGTIHGFILFSITAYVIGVIYAALYFYLMVLQYVRLLIVCLMCNVLMLLRNKYKIINNKLTEYQFCTIIKNRTSEKLEEIVRLFLECDKIVQLFNKIFGWPLLFIFAGSAGILLGTLALTTEGIIISPEKGAAYNRVFIVNLFHGLMAMVSAC